MNPSASVSPRRSLLLRERRPRRCRLTSDDVAYLSAEHRDHLAIEPTEKRGCYRLIPTGHVGAIVCPNARLIIHPKIPVSDFLRLLDPSAAIDTGEDHTVTEAGTAAFNVLAGRFARLLSAQITTGLHRGYAEHSEAGPFLQGRLDVSAQLRQTGRKNHLHCTYDEFTVDVPPNRVLKATIELLLRSPLLHPAVSAELGRLLAAFPAVATQSLQKASFDAPIPDRLTASYRPLLALCRLLYEGLTAGKQSGGVICPAFLLNMDRVFEQYVSEGLIAEFAKSDRCTLAIQPLWTVGSPTGDQPGLQMRPDLLLSRAGAPDTVIDVKWKTLPANALRSSDVYQVLAYAAALGTRRAVLIYPGGRSKRWRYHFEPTSLDLDVFTLRMTGSVSACRRSLKQLGRALRSVHNN